MWFWSKALIASIAFAAFAVASPAQEHPTRPVTAAPGQAAADFLTRAAQSALFEMEAARVAMERSESADIRQFAAMMLTDHAASSAQLMAAAEQDGLRVPQATGLERGRADDVERLRRVGEADFDKVFLTQQARAHESALELHRAYARDGEGFALKAAAAEVARVIERHLAHVKVVGK